jgi:uncharacterized protein (DUF488 family)
VAAAGLAPRPSGTSLIGAGAEDRPALHTVGHSVLPLAGFIDLLRGAGIAALADVRRFPGSRRHPHFGRDVLEAALPEAGIDYRWFEALGGRRSGPVGADSPNRGLRVAAFRAYADYALTPDFQAALASLLEWSAGRATAICCAEGLWWQCHRRLIADHLVARGHPVHHVLPNGSLVPHELWDLARLTPSGPVYPPEQPDLLADGG